MRISQHALKGLIQNKMSVSDVVLAVKKPVLTDSGSVG